MKPAEMEARMRELEYYHSTRIVPGVWPVVRVDGRGFTRLTTGRFDKPFDARFRELMVAAAEALLRELQGLYAYTESDEISVLLPRDWSLFDRELEKTVSLSAAIASAAFTHALGEPAQFDARVWIGPGEDEVLDYFRWRQADAARGALNGQAYWTLRQAGASVAEATERLRGRDAAYKRELLRRHGVDFDALPAWQRLGTALYWERWEKRGWDPHRGVETVATRRRLKVDTALPMEDAYGRFVAAFLDSKE